MVDRGRIEHITSLSLACSLSLHRHHHRMLFLYVVGLYFYTNTNLGVKMDIFKKMDYILYHLQLCPISQRQTIGKSLFGARQTFK